MTRKPAEISHGFADMSNHSLGHLMFDPELPDDQVSPIDDAFAEVGRWHTVSLVEGFVRPVLQTERERVIGTEAIIGYVKSMGPAA